MPESLKSLRRTVELANDINTALRRRNDRLAAALRLWTCVSCGGSGRYHQNASGTARAIKQGRALDPQFNPEPVVCKVCGGSGQHPIAAAALAAQEEKI